MHSSLQSDGDIHPPLVKIKHLCRKGEPPRVQLFDARDCVLISVLEVRAAACMFREFGYRYIAGSNGMWTRQPAGGVQ
jgi:hypothetical protein